MARAYPCLYIEDYEEAVKFYVDFLKFEIDFEWRHQEGFPVYMGVSRGESPGIETGIPAFHLTEHKVPVHGTLLDVEDVYAFYEDLKSRDEQTLDASGDAGQAPELVAQPWGKTELHLIDPFGNRLVLTSPSKEQHG